MHFSGEEAEKGIKESKMVACYPAIGGEPCPSLRNCPLWLTTHARLLRGHLQTTRVTPLPHILTTLWTLLPRTGLFGPVAGLLNAPQNQDITISSDLKDGVGTSLVVQWPRLHTPNVGDLGWIPDICILSHDQLCGTLCTVTLCLMRLLCPWDSPGKNYWSGDFLQGIFLTQGSNPRLLHWRRILYC